MAVFIIHVMQLHSSDRNDGGSYREAIRDGHALAISST